jgi:hypothetical protein
MLVVFPFSKLPISHGETMKIIKKVALIAAAASAIIVVVLLVAWWAKVSTEVAHVTFSNNRYCKLQFHQWNTGRSVLSYYENGICIGVVQLNNDLFNDPLAMFPGPDGQSVVCLSWPDTYNAAFTVDFSKRSPGGMPIPKRLQLYSQEAVDFSNFKVRACTPEEVDFVRDYIKRVDLKTFASCTRWGASGATEDQREDALRFLTWATSPNNWQDPILKDAVPLILPEEVDVAEAKELETTHRDTEIGKFRKYAPGKTVFDVSNAFTPGEWQKETAVSELDIAASSPGASFPVKPPFVGKTVMVLSSEVPTEDTTDVYVKLSPKVNASDFREMFFRADPRGKNVVIEEVGVTGD